MANYPSSASTDANLYVTVNSLETSLAGPLTSSGGNNGSDIEVVSTAGFPATGFITIDQEAISYTSLLSAPPRFSGIARGADGTIASAHSGGSTTKHNVIAAHHNVLKEEVKAIETDLLTGNPPLRLTGGTMTGAVLLANGTQSAPAVAFGSDPDTGIHRVGSNFLAIDTGGSQRVQIYDTDVEVLVPLRAKGTITNDSASAGNIGEYVSSAVTPTNLPTSGQWGDLTSISLTAGDWDVRMHAEYENNAATSPLFFDLGASVTSGNSGTDLTLGDTYLEMGVNDIPTGSNVMGMCGPTIRFSLSATTTVYFKVRASYSGTAPQAAGRISARRVR